MFSRKIITTGFFTEREKPIKGFWKTIFWVKNPSQGFSRKPLRVVHRYEKPFRVSQKMLRGLEVVQPPFNFIRHKRFWRVMTRNL
jgi:hypothetical protein